jgi:hypothetical protein
MNPNNGTRSIVDTFNVPHIRSWLIEFGYSAGSSTFSTLWALGNAINERGSDRVSRELRVHAQRRAQ